MAFQGRPHVDALAVPIAHEVNLELLARTRRENGYRTVILSDLLAFERDSQANAKKHLQEMRDIAEEGGFYDNDEAIAAYLDSFL